MSKKISLSKVALLSIILIPTQEMLAPGRKKNEVSKAEESQLKAPPVSPQDDSKQQQHNNDDNNTNSSTTAQQQPTAQAVTTSSSGGFLSNLPFIGRAFGRSSNSAAAQGASRPMTPTRRLIQTASDENAQPDAIKTALSEAQEAFNKQKKEHAEAVAMLQSKDIKHAEQITDAIVIALNKLGTKGEISKASLSSSDTFLRSITSESIAEARKQTEHALNMYNIAAKPYTDEYIKAVGDGGLSKSNLNDLPAPLSPKSFDEEVKRISSNDNQQK